MVNKLRNAFLILYTLLVWAATVNYTFAQNSNFNPKQTFSKQALVADFRQLRTMLETELANLYLYTPKSEMDACFDSCEKAIDSMNYESFYNLVTPVMAKIKDGHALLLPGQKYLNYHDEHSGFLPFNAAYIEGNLIITQNFSDNAALAPGTQILAINQVSASEIHNFMMVRLVREGHNVNYGEWIFNTFFKDFYSFSFGHPSRFNLNLASNTGDITSITIDAIAKDSIIAIKNRTLSINKNGIYLNHNSETKTSVLVIKTWDKDLLKKRYHQRFKPQIRKAIRAVKKQNASNLIIDLRGNQGGKAEYGIYLMRHLMPCKFKYVDGIFKVHKHRDTGQELQAVSNKIVRYYLPKFNAFHGKIYILTDGGSFSNSAIFTSRMHFYKRAEIVGQASGGSAVVLTGSFGLGTHKPLTNTGMVFDKNNYRILIENGKPLTGYGVTPDFSIETKVQDIVNKIDPQMEFTIGLIKKRQSQP